MSQFRQFKINHAAFTVLTADNQGKPYLYVTADIGLNERVVHDVTRDNTDASKVAVMLGVWRDLEKALIVKGYRLEPLDIYGIARTVSGEEPLRTMYKAVVEAMKAVEKSSKTSPAAGKAFLPAARGAVQEFYRRALSAQLTRSGEAQRHKWERAVGQELDFTLKELGVPQESLPAQRIRVALSHLLRRAVDEGMRRSEDLTDAVFAAAPELDNLTKHDLVDAMGALIESLHGPRRQAA